MRKTARIANKGLITIAIVIVIAIVIFVFYLVKLNKEDKESLNHIFAEIDSQNANLTEYIIYGTHLNLKGEIIENIENLKNIKLIIARNKWKRRRICFKL